MAATLWSGGGGKGEIVVGKNAIVCFCIICRERGKRREKKRRAPSLREKRGNGARKGEGDL